MTSATRQTRPVLPIGQAVGQAEASLTRVLAGVLAESGTSREAYLGLQRLTALGGQGTRDTYQRDLSDWLQLDEPAAANLSDELVSAGLAEAEGDMIRLTARGQALRDAILGAAAKITGPALAALDPDDLEITVRTLQEVTRRVRGIPAGRAAAEGNR